MPEFEAGVLEVWAPDQYPAHQPGAQGVCRFAPDCANGKGDGMPSHPGCPGNPAEFSELTGGSALAGYTRYIPLCRARAVSRFGQQAVDFTEAVGAT